MGYFHYFAIIGSCIKNIASKNIQLFVRVSLGYKPRSGTAETEMYAHLQSF